jgi:hypothetical protein
MSESLLLFDNPPFLPTRIGGGNLKLWLDASDTSTITGSGGSVSAWAGKDGNSYIVTQGIGSRQPTTGVSTSNGKNVLNFDGGDILAGNTALNAAMGAIASGASTVFVIARRNTEDGTTQNPFVANQLATSTNYRVGFSSTAGNIFFQSGGFSTFTGATNTDFQIFTGTRSGVDMTAQVNQETVVATTTGVDRPLTNSFFVGAIDTGLAQALVGSIGEIIIYNRLLSTGEIARVQAYLTNKWLGFVTPTDIQGLQAWYDTTSDDYLTLDGTAITQMLDRSGQGNDTGVQGTASSRPTRALSQINGLQAATFDGGDVLSIPSALYSIPDGDNTIILVSKRTSEDGTTDSILGFRDGAVGKLVIFYDTVSGILRYRSNDTGTNNVTSTGNTNTDFNISTAYRDGVTQSLSINGGVAQTDANGSDATGIDGAVIGEGSTSAFPLAGVIAEILIFNRALTSTEIDNINTYLSNKYNIGLA